MNIRTLIYARVSTEDQVEKYGLPLQLRACRELAARDGLTITEEITDDGISGTLLDRPGLNRVRELVATQAVDVVLMYDVDRLSRELAHLLILKPEIERRARLAFVAANFEDSPSGRMFFGIRGVVAQYEREQMRERVMRGKREAARAGRVLGGRVCYGYTYASGVITPDPERAPIVRRIFERFLTGTPVRRITRDLREDGVPSWTGRKWGASSVRRILENETYAGVAHFGTHRREGTLLRLRDPRERIAVSVPAIVSHEQWERAQSRFGERLPVGRPTAAFLLRGILRCPCGMRMCGQQDHREARGGTRSYRCAGRDTLRHRGEHCKRVLSAAQMDAAVWQALEGTFTDPGVLRNVLHEYQRELQQDGPEKSEALARQLRTLKAREERCLSLLLDQELAASADLLKRKYLAAQKERVAVEREVGRIEAAKRKAASAEEWLTHTVDLLRGFVPTLTTAEERHGFVRGLVSRAEWDGGGAVKLHCFFGAEMSTTCSRSDHFPPSSEFIQFVVTARLAA